MTKQELANNRTVLLLITGPPGAGKTTTADLLPAAFSSLNISHDKISITSTNRELTPSFDIAVQNLSSTWQNYVKAGIRCVILDIAAESSARIRRIRKAVGDSTVFVVLLTPPVKALAARLDVQDMRLQHPDAERRLQHSRRVVEKLALNSLVIYTDEKPEKIASLISDKVGKYLIDREKAQETRPTQTELPQNSTSPTPSDSSAGNGLVQTLQPAE